MNRILITGMNSYIGNELEQYLEKPLFQGDFQITKCSLRNKDLDSLDLTAFHSIVHVAGIAHVDSGDVTEEIQNNYKKINYELTIALAKRAKEQGVQQFIYISSMIVYGESELPGRRKIITADTLPTPVSTYGNSKLLAEQELIKLNSESFCVTIVRPPMVYGRHSKGNYPKLSKLSRYLLFFPKIPNQRSMIYIENLCELFRLLILEKRVGIFCPDNQELISTFDLVKEISKVHGKKIIGIRFFNPLIYVSARYLSSLRKIFGNIEYDRELSNCDGLKYRIYNFEESILKTESKQDEK